MDKNMELKMINDMRKLNGLNEIAIDYLLRTDEISKTQLWKKDGKKLLMLPDTTIEEFDILENKQRELRHKKWVDFPIDEIIFNHDAKKTDEKWTATIDECNATNLLFYPDSPSKKIELNNIDEIIKRIANRIRTHFKEAKEETFNFLMGSFTDSRNSFKFDESFACSGIPQELRESNWYPEPFGILTEYIGD